MPNSDTRHTSFALIALDRLRQKYTWQSRRRDWRARTEPFWHRGAKNLEFNLIPGEYIDGYIYMDGLYEKPFLYLLERLLIKRGTMLDIGANIGNHSLFFSTMFDMVHSFEPNPDTVARLNSNIAKNNAANVKVYAFGLSSENAELPFMQDTIGNAGKSQFVENEQDASCMLEVKIGDSVVGSKHIDSIDFIKIDVEGHELSVLQGLRKTIQEHQPVVALEFHAGEFPQQYFDKFAQALPGYRFFECGDFRGANTSAPTRIRKYIEQRGLMQIKHLRSIEPRTYENILALPANCSIETAHPNLIYDAPVR